METRHKCPWFENVSENHTKRKITSYWDETVTQYDHEFGGGISSADEERIYRTVLQKHLALTPGARILEVGCGTGELTVVLAGLGYKVFGIDISWNMLARAIEKNNDSGLGILFSKGDAEAPPFRAETFDAVFSRHLIWTLPDPDRAVANWLRLLKPGGVLLTIDGVWIHQGFEPRLRRLLANILVSFKKKRIHRAWTKYYPANRKGIPLFGGTGPQSIAGLFERHGLTRVWTDSLDELISHEKKHAPIEYHLLYTQNPRYLVGGIKEGV